MKRLLLTATLLGLAFPASVLAWTPPVGIPAPTWPANLDMARPSVPSPWTSEQAGIYYVESTSCSDSRVYGRPGAPRCSLPSSPAAGSVVVLNGTLTGSKIIGYRGNSTNPIWIIGLSTTAKPTVAGDWDLTGSSYVILDGLAWNYNSRDGNAFDGNHLMVRDCTYINPFDSANGTGFGIGGQNIVYYRNTISQMGDWQYTGTGDIDRHGIKVYGPVAADIWIVDSTFYHCHGDGVQVGDQNNTASQIQRVYLGRNTAYQNYQSGFWVKNAMDVVFSQNTVYNMTTASPYSPGVGLGGQYDPLYVWYLLNRIHDCKVGIHVAGASSGGGGPWFMIGNVLSHIDSSGGGAYDGGALGNRNTGTVGIFFNTVYDADIFVSTAPGPSPFTVRNNIFSSLRSGGAAYANAGVAIVHDYNLYTSSAYDPDGEPHRIVADPKFVSQAAGNFSLQAASPAINAANPTEEAAYALFQSRYGLDIRRDIAGAVRPQSSRWDIGGYEGVGTPAAPTNIRIIK